MNKKFSLYPQNEKDYFRIWKWQVSKRLIITAIIMAGIASFLYVVSYMHNASVNGEKSNIYKYNSLILPYINGKVKIKASSGYIAYEGEVEGGSVSGIGTLYGSDGHIIYNGEFKENQYSGGGRLYDGDGNLVYDGEFRDNLYEGEGVEYFDGGQYEGEFHRGKKEGYGVLKDTSGNNVYTGNFSDGYIVYQDFLGKSTNQAGEMYTGKREIYYDSSYFIVDMKEISAVYIAETLQETLEEDLKISKVFIVSDIYKGRGKEASSIEEISRIMGEPYYEGNLYINQEEAVVLGSSSELQVNRVFEDAMEITGYDENKVLYIYNFEEGNIQYTFYCEEKNENFIMYSMEGIEDM